MRAFTAIPLPKAATPSQQGFRYGTKRLPRPAIQKPAQPTPIAA